MYNNLKNYLKTHRKSVLTVSVVALVAVGAMLLGQAGYLGGSGSNLTGALINSRGTALTQQPLKNPSNLKIRPPIIATGTLIVEVTPATGTFEVYNSKTGALAVAKTSDSQKLAIPLGEYKVVFLPLTGFTTPASQPAALTQTSPNTKVAGIYNVVPVVATVAFTASATNITSNSVTLSTNYKPKNGQFFNGSCAPFTGLEQSAISMTPPVTVGNLKADTDYACRINIFPSATGGQTIGMSDEVKVRTAPATINPPVAVTGTLSISSEGNIAPKILVAGTSMQLVSKYRVSAVREDFTISKLTAINDLSGAFDIPQNTVAVDKVILKYTDPNGVAQTVSGSLAMGGTTFSGLTLKVPAGQSAPIEIYADINHMSAVGETLSGQMFRLGILEGGNSSSTFEAMSASGAAINNPTIQNSSAIGSFVVRKSVLTFAKASGLSTSLVAGENRIFGITVTADNAGPISFGRLSFTVNNGSNGTLNQFRFYRGPTLLSYALGSVNIRNGATGDDLTTTGSLAAMTSTDVIVSFNQEETVGAGQSQTYYLDATVNSSMMNDSITTKLAIGDEINSASGIQSSDFTALTIPGRSIIWSDQSADVHVYPTIVAGVATPGTGSADWTNGFLLGASSLPSQTLTK